MTGYLLWLAFALALMASGTALGHGTFDRHRKHARPGAHRRAEAARQATADDQWAAFLHEINTDGYLPAPTPAPVVALGPPPAAVLADTDVPGLEHLQRPDYEFDTGQWPLMMQGMSDG